jgi:hypothetical protein
MEAVFAYGLQPDGNYSPQVRKPSRPSRQEFQSGLEPSPPIPPDVQPSFFRFAAD